MSASRRPQCCRTSGSVPCVPGGRRSSEPSRRLPAVFGRPGHWPCSQLQRLQEPPSFTDEAEDDRAERRSQKVASSSWHAQSLRDD